MASKGFHLAQFPNTKKLFVFLNESMYVFLSKNTYFGL